MLADKMLLHTVFVRGTVRALAARNLFRAVVLLVVPVQAGGCLVGHVTLCILAAEKTPFGLALALLPLS